MLASSYGFREPSTYERTISQCSPSDCTSCLGKRAQRLECRYLETSSMDREYGVRLMKPWILHAKLELQEGTVTQSWSGVFCRGTIWDLWCVYQPPSMQFGT
ncbi:hypothetical protein TNCV_1889251 [Trichonephila clavipes]|nr:hypothetical protein TNCV_1889251 [Trichonephila clavipes]